MKKEDLKVGDTIFITSVAVLIIIRDIMCYTDKNWNRCIVIIWDDMNLKSKTMPNIDSIVLFEKDIESKILSFSEYETRKEARKKERILYMRKAIERLESD